MTRAVRIDQNGGPEVLKIVDVTVGDPGPGEIRIRHKAVGLNFIDVYQRTGLYPLPMPLSIMAAPESKSIASGNLHTTLAGITRTSQ